MSETTGDGLGAGRRWFLKQAAGAAVGAAALPASVQKALALPANHATGSLKDIEHVVILMQENRSFDHYFGTLRGVRGFGDPRALTLPDGRPVWRQAARDGKTLLGPFRLNADTTRAESLYSLDHSWKGAHATWKHHDAWGRLKGPMSMGYFTRQDLPFYYALADAFTICDGYHCSVFGPTNPNRLYLFSGTSGLTVGDDSKTAIDNPPDEPSEAADPAKDSKTFKAFGWTTYAERLQAAGISWKLYQEYDNYGDNGLAYFANFRGIGPENPLYQRGRAWAAGSTPENAKTTQGEPLVAAFAADVAAGRLPAVSWIVAPYKLCEHPSASPAAGEHLTARLIDALTAHPEVWAKTAFILNYDENDGFFDHAPPPTPAVGTALGQSTVETTGEVYHGEPIGLGPRVPLIVVSPWTKGGYVNSQLFDHTSVIRLLEARFGVAEPNISPWRRAVCGDLTSVFDFAAPGAAPALPDASALPARAEKAQTLPWPKTPAEPLDPPRQEPGQRPARALPYAFEVAGQARADGLALTLANTGAAGAAFNLYVAGGGEPRFYTVEAGKRIQDQIAVGEGAYGLTLHGPNGFLRAYRGARQGARLFSQARFEAASGRLLIALRNDGDAALTVSVSPRDYVKAAPRGRRLAPGESAVEAWSLTASRGWYDFAVTCQEDPAFEHRLAGHGEDGRPSVSDPALGRQA